MLQFTQILLVHRQGIPQDRSGILHGISLGQSGPDRFGPDQADHHQKAEQASAQTLKSQPNRQGEPQVLKGLWHSRMIP